MPPDYIDSNVYGSLPKEVRALISKDGWRILLPEGRIVWLLCTVASQSSTLSALQQQLADALLTARYQSDVARQADDAREKAEQERDTAIATAADTIFTTTQAWVEQLGALQAENAGLRAALTQLTVPLYSTRTENAIQRGVRDFARNALADAGPQERP
jgi:malonyl CoA-acyl carrier protein transacylase